jgi:beta-galactosidase
VEAFVPSAAAWDLKHPNLYQAFAELPGLPAGGKAVSFGFRFFTARGIGGKDAKLTLNGRRFVMLSSISWGFWGRNGLWPDAEMAEREVDDAKTLGLNCLSFHRNIGKPAVLDVQDRKGLLRFEEPGAGKFLVGTRYSQGPWGPNGEFPPGDANDAHAPKKGYVEPDWVDTSGKGPDGDAQAFWEKYEEEKILRMVKRDRSHPSLVAYTLQNEASELDLRNPRIYRVMREMHALDPSRIINFFSGGDPKIAQVRMMPYDETIMCGSKKIPYAGWRDVHTCGGPCNYLDALYKSPTDFSQHWPDDAKPEIAIWGEALGAATPDDYDRLVHSFDAAHPTGYELDDSRKVLDAYHTFLDQYGFRRAFPTDSSLFQAIGYRTYEFWRRIIEQSRFDNTMDGLVISGWESTTIDNHSGLVDSHRFFKGDPKVIAEATQPELLVIQPRRVIVALGETVTVDLYLINETGRKGPQNLKLTARRPDGTVAFTKEKAVVAQGGETYGQLLAEGIEIPADTAGMLSIEATLMPREVGVSILIKKDSVEVVDAKGGPILRRIAVLEDGNEVSSTLHDTFGVTASKFGEVTEGEHLDAIVLAPKAIGQDRNSSPQVPDAVMAQALERVKNDGTRLVLWPDDNFRAETFVRQLREARVITGGENVGNLNAPWFGSWFFVRKHWLLDGLPADCAMDWRYGVSAFGGPSWLKDSPGGSITDGYLLDAPGIDVAVGFGADHSTRVGISGCVIPWGKGEIVLMALPQEVRSLGPGDFAISQVVARRLLGNALRKVTH